MMKAIFCRAYGKPANVMELRDMALPEPRQGEVRVKVRYAAVNDFDLSLVTGIPKAYRPIFGFFSARCKTPGIELSGIVEKVATEGGQFKLGDEIYGDISGTQLGGGFAEYICVSEKSLRCKPADISFADAASLPHAGCLAVQGLIDAGHILEPQKILINGAGGGVGSIALQIAKEYGSEVTGVDAGEKLQRMKTYGFDNVIDYRDQNFTERSAQYDLILDAKTSFSPSALARSLKPRGTYVSVGGNVSKLLQLALFGHIAGRIHKKSLRIVALKPNKDLALLENLWAAGKLKSVPLTTFDLHDAAAAIEHFAQAKHHGKILLRMS